MNAFFGLLKKDLLISRFWYSVFLTAMIVAMVAAVLLSYRWGEPGLLVPLLFTMIPVQIFFLPIAVGAMLRVEGKTQLWLYNPQSSLKLLLSKIIVSFIFLIISQIVFFVFLATLLKLVFNLNINELLPLNVIPVTFASFILVSLYLTILFIFLWTIYHSLGKFPALKNFRWLVVTAIFFGYNTIETLVGNIPAVNDLVYKYQFTFYTSTQFSYETGSGWEFILEQIPVPIIPVIYHSSLALVLLIVASRLLDKKVEV